MTTNKYGPKRILGNPHLFPLCQISQMIQLSSPFPSSVVAASFSQCLAPKQKPKNFPECQARIKPRLVSDVVRADRQPAIPSPFLISSPHPDISCPDLFPFQDSYPGRDIEVTSQSPYGFPPEAPSPNPCKLRSGCTNLQGRAETSRQW